MTESVALERSYLEIKFEVNLTWFFLSSRATIHLKNRLNAVSIFKYICTWNRTTMKWHWHSFYELSVVSLHQIESWNFVSPFKPELISLKTLGIKISSNEDTSGVDVKLEYPVFLQSSSWTQLHIDAGLGGTSVEFS